jgi:hypothetical protein
MWSSRRCSFGVTVAFGRNVLKHTKVGYVHLRQEFAAVEVMAHSKE